MENTEELIGSATDNAERCLESLISLELVYSQLSSKHGNDYDPERVKAAVDECNDLIAIIGDLTP